MRHLLLLTLLLLCSCVTSKKVKDYLEKAENQPAAEAIVADWLEQNREWYAAKAAKDFPVKKSDSAAAVTEVKAPTIEKQPEPEPIRIKSDSVPRTTVATPPVRRAPARIMDCDCPDVAFFEKTISQKEQQLQQNTGRLKAARAALSRERSAHQETKRRLKVTEAERDYFEEKNRKKVWALVAMGIFAVLYVIFRVAASRVRTS